jgi:hypothetical protein
VGRVTTHLAKSGQSARMSSLAPTAPARRSAASGSLTRDDCPPAPSRRLQADADRRAASGIAWASSCVTVEGGFIEWLMIGTGVSGAGPSHAPAERVGARMHR